MAFVGDEILLDMKAECALLPKVIGSITVLSDTLERAKRSLEAKFGMPGVYDFEYSQAWSDIDNTVCRLRELVSDYDGMLAENRNR